MSDKNYNLVLAGFPYSNCWFKFAQYADGSPAILIESAEGPVGRVTVNLDVAPAEGCIWVKDYSENEGLAAELMKLDLIEPTGREQRSGFVTVQEYRLKGAWAGAH